LEVWKRREVGRSGEVLAEISAALDGVLTDTSLLSDADALALVGQAREVAGRVQALAATLAADAEARGVSERAYGTPLSSWLTGVCRLTRPEAHRLLASGRALSRFAAVGEAARSGQVGVEQASAITTVLSRLPQDFSTSQVAEAEALLLGYAAEFDSRGLAHLTWHLLEVLDPVAAEHREQRLLERDLREARAARFVVFKPDGHGSVLLRGSLPSLDAEPLVRLVEAYAEDDRRKGLERLDPAAEFRTTGMRRADALCALAAAHQEQGLAPACGGERPRVVVTISFEQLRADCVRAGVLGSGELITPGQLRRLACDAEILPVVLGGASEVLDVGRAQRLVTPAIRTALSLRDQGCVFPGCDKSPGGCHAHHLVPWWCGGETSLKNLVLLCPHHHGLLEPSRDGPDGRRWTVQLGRDGVPEVRPPAYVDAGRRPRRHQRFRDLRSSA
jgi:hypothetical protein